MRTLDELGISPAPWKVGAIAGDDKGLVVFDRNNCAVVLMHELAEYRNADARLIAAAPELYEALREAVCVICNDCGNHFGSKCRNKLTPCYVKKLREVLAKASGESEVAK